MVLAIGAYDWHFVVGGFRSTTSPARPATQWVARPDPIWGETPCVFVTLKPEAEIDGKGYPCRDSHLVWSELATSSGLPSTVVPIDRS